jgi:N utilization substance protein B
MLFRRFLRIKTFQALYAYKQDQSTSRAIAQKNLVKSLDKAYDVYIFLLSFVIEFKFFLGKEIEIQENKYIPQPEQLAFIKAIYNNGAILMLENDSNLKEKIKDSKFDWSKSTDLFRQLFTEIKDLETLLAATKDGDYSIFAEKQILLEIVESLVADSEVFNDYMEQHFINWEDDDVMALMAFQKTLSTIKQNKQPEILNGFYNDKFEDTNFVSDLFFKTLEHDDYLTELISSKTQNWDTERIATVDMLLMKMAMCEITMFSQIPVKVSINEYLEIAKIYSSPNSHTFMNGVLDKVQLELRKDDKINKTGRGLME